MDWSWLDTAVGAGLVLVGHATGWMAHARRRRPARDPEPICGCEHHYSMHDPETNACHDMVMQVVSGGARRPFQCTCRRYVGPEPLPRMIP